MMSADEVPEPLTRCDRCVWWVSRPDGTGTCPYRAASVGTNSQWKDIVLGRCSHYLRDPGPDQPTDIPTREPTESADQAARPPYLE